MKLQQLRFICEVAKHNLNLTKAANELFTSQPGISKQIKALEEELGVDIFIRRGKRFVGITEPGKEIINKSRSLKGVLEPFSDRGNTDLLKRAGFKDIITVFQWLCFKGYLCIK